MNLNLFGIKTPKRTSVDRFDYQRAEERRLLAADFSIAETTLLNQLAADSEVAWTQQGLNQLSIVGADSGKSGTTTVLQQSWNGLPVYGSFVTVVQDSSGSITNVRNQAKPNIEGYAPDMEPISESLALRIGSQDLGKSSELDSEASMAWYFTGNRARLSWLVESTVFDSEGEVAGEYETWVNIFDGEIFAQETKGATISSKLADPLTETGVFPRIVINDAIGVSGSRAYAAPFDAVVSIGGCSGTLVSPDTVLTARHCGVGSGTTVRFGDNLNSPVGQFTVATAVNPAGGNANSPLLDGGDFTIATLTANVPASVATPMRLIDAGNELVGMTAATIGYGWNGLGSSGHGFSADGFRWGGENIIDRVGAPAGSNGANIISTDFDDGSNAANTIGGSDSTPLTLEATTAPGDSGGPILVNVGGEWAIAGVLSGGTTNTSVYGDISWWTGTSVFRAEIENAGGVFLGDGAGSVRFAQDNYFVGNTVELTVRDGNAPANVNVTITSESGDSETVTLNSTNGVYNFSIGTSDAGVMQDDGVLQVAAGDNVTVAYTDADNGDGQSEEITASVSIIDLSNPLIGVDFGDTTNPPLNWRSLGAVTGTVNDLSFETTAASPVDLTITGNSDVFAVSLNANTVPQYANSLANLEGQIYTGADPIAFTWSDLEPSTDYFVYVMSAEGFYDSIEQTVTISGGGNPVTFEQRFDNGDLFVNDQLGDSSRDLSEYALVITSDSSGEIGINIDPIAGTEDVVLAGLAITKVSPPPVAPSVELNESLPDRSIVDEAVLAFSEVMTFDADAFELVKRGPDGGAVGVTPTLDNSSGQSIVTLTFSGEFVDGSGSLVDGNYQLTVRGDRITSSSGVALDGDGDGVAGGDMVFGDTEADNFFRLLGDADGSRSVNVVDLLNLRNTFNASDGDSNFDDRFDFNGDGIINVLDLLPFRQNYLTSLDFV